MDDPLTMWVHWCDAEKDRVAVAWDQACSWCGKRVFTISKPTELSVNPPIYGVK